MAMFPDPADVGDSTAAGEQLIERMTLAALNSWSAEALAFALPSLTAAADDLPADPDALTRGRATTSWSAVAEPYVVGASMALWSLTVADASAHFGAPLDPAEYDGELSDEVVRAVAEETGRPAAEVVAAYAAVKASPELVAPRAAIESTVRAEAGGVPGEVQYDIATDTKATTRDETRRVVSAALKPNSETFTKVSRLSSYQAAGTMNAAVLDASRRNAFGAELDKTWIATLDRRTRRSHWAADGQRVPIDSPFTVGGESLDYPGDPKGSARETKRCRCRVGALDRDDPIPSDIDRHTERLDGRDSTARNRDGASQADEIERREREGNVRARDDEDGLGRVASGGWNAPSEMTYEIGESTMSETTGGELFRTFTSAAIGVIGEPTSDGRMFAADIDLSFRDFPLALMWTKQTSQGHEQAYTVGVIETASIANGKIIADGYLLNTPEANEAAAQIAHGITGPSVDLADAEWELTREDGTVITEDEYWDLPAGTKVYQTITKAELVGTTLVPIPAFGQTTIALDAERSPRDVGLVASLVASAEEFRPRVYKAEFFDDPQLDGPTLPTMGDDGRIYGHLACFGQCHRSVQSECIIAPRSATNYAHFHTSPAVRLDDGRRLPVGRLTVGTGHAGDRVGPNAAAAHYDNTGTAFALVRVGEDAHGVWFSGVAAPGATAEQIEQGITAPLSGDWRDFGGGLELVAALAVNTPGFVARGADDDAGRPIALVASIGPDPRTLGGPAKLTVEDIAKVVRVTLDEVKLAEETEPLIASARELVTASRRQQVATLLKNYQEGK
ncbi:portal protein [Tsukamurella phage TPA2]|uniref:portal protein n=1 Tax=Tsukamurella phage TPA2 TaxID=981330 RepID=UPI0001FF8DA9|nr:portal protein [Tsukamurella phage TPA2]ADX31932.1 putative capsid protein [Tsukamurella phage TPA2]